MGDAFLILVVIFMLVMVYSVFKKKRPNMQPEGAKEKQILQEYVVFYQKLTIDEKTEFESRVQRFLQKVRITGVDTIVEDRDKVFVAAGAIIPIFAFKGWEYRNIHEVLLYPDTFNKDFHTEGKERNVLGMVGNGPMQDVMILSQPELRNGFLNSHTESNTAIHEFVHLIDKEDGSTDGYPRNILPYQYIMPWIKRIHEEIKLIEKGQSDINPYGITNEAEFLAVAAEYFFEQPEMMHQKHPELYALLKQAFTPELVNEKK